MLFLKGDIFVSLWLFHQLGCNSEISAHLLLHEKETWGCHYPRAGSRKEDTSFDWLWCLPKPCVHSPRACGGQDRVVTGIPIIFSISKHASCAFQWFRNGKIYFAFEQKPLKIFWKMLDWKCDKLKTFGIFPKRFSDVGQMLLFADPGLCRMTENNLML